MQETALVIINMQVVRTNKSSDYYLGNMEEMIEKTNVLISYAREMNYKIIFVKHTEALGDFSLQNPLSELIPELDYQTNIDKLIIKNKISSFYKTQMVQELEGIENIVVCGALTNLCVRMFVEEAYDRDFRVAVIDDLTATFTNELQEMTLEDLYTTRSGISILPLEKFIE